MSFAKSFNVIFLPVYIICSVGILANLMLLIAFIKDPLKCFRNSATYLVGNLALSDLLLNLMLITGMFLESENEVVVFLQYVSFYSSMLTIFSIALDRYLMIAYPFKHRFLMSEKKMAIWIAFIWFLSSVHPVKNIFIRNENDVNAKPGVGLVFILFTAVLYGKTYFALRKQARSMIGKKTTFSSKQSQYAPNKSSSIESETCVGTNNHVKNGIERDQSLDERAQIQYERDEIENERAKSQSERDQSLVERAENKNHRAQNQYEAAEIENVRAESESEREQSLDERAESQNHCAEKQNDRAQNPYERAEIENERAESYNQRAQDKNERVESENEPAQREDLSSNKTPKNSQVINNTKEQKFLNTIIIIACIAVVTVLPGTIYSLLSGRGVYSEGNSILSVVGIAIFCLNFAANPFVYCLRLKRYRETFKMVYGCKH